MFFDFWTLKEAYIKARGFGLALPLGDFTLTLNPPHRARDRFRTALEDDPTTWQFLQDWPTPTHRLALAVRRDGSDLPVRIRRSCRRHERTASLGHQRSACRVR